MEREVTGDRGGWGRARTRGSKGYPVGGRDEKGIIIMATGVDSSSPSSSCYGPQGPFPLERQRQREAATAALGRFCFSSS
jgi:hypothetical protein